MKTITKITVSTLLVFFLLEHFRCSSVLFGYNSLFRIGIPLTIVKFLNFCFIILHLLLSINLLTSKENGDFFTSKKSYDFLLLNTTFLLSLFYLILKGIDFYFDFYFDNKSLLIVVIDFFIYFVFTTIPAYLLWSNARNLSVFRI